MRLLPLVMLLGACVRPFPIARESFMRSEIEKREPSRVLLRPRFGLPAIVQAGAPIPIELARSGEVRAALVAATLSDGEARRCASGEALEGCVHLVLGEGSARPEGTVEPGGWDLVILGGELERARRAVWLRADDPSQLSELRVAHLSDLHVGKRSAIPERLAQVVAELNVRAPDLVVVTGDVAESGDRAALFDRAAAVLSHLEAPLVVVPGNHDHGFGPGAFSGRKLGEGWTAFAHTFHPFLFFEFQLGRWRFIGFDSGASMFSPFILTRGVSDETVQAIRERIEGAPSGVVLMSHAPTRARLTGHRPSRVRGLFGHMLYGSQQLEAVMLEAARAGHRVLHLSGHTHWSDVFESDERGFVRWDHKLLTGGPHDLKGGAALVGVQSATHTTFPTFDNGRGRGYMWLTLRDGAASVELKRVATSSDAPRTRSGSL
jgi:predicted phosphodiesterase